MRKCSAHAVTGSQKAAIVDLASGVTQLDRDFVLLVKTERPHQPRVCVEVAADGSVATMITLAPLIELDEIGCELVFIVDRSGSMAGSKIDNARKAMTVRLQWLSLECFLSLCQDSAWQTPRTERLH